MATAVGNEPRDLWIGGRTQEAVSGNRYDVIDPTSGTAIASVADASPADVEEAIEAAESGLEMSDWPNQLPFARGAVLREFAILIRRNLDELAVLETANNGQPIRESRTQLMGAATLFDYYAGLAPTMQGASPGMGPDLLDFTILEPYGVVGVIVPFNAPAFTLAMKCAPALAVGNGIIVKPSPYTPLTALRLGELAHEAGIPAGVFNVLASADSATGEALVRHQRVPKISFTGSSITGSKILASGADQVKHITLELGGKSANLICPDADISEAVVSSVYFSMFRSAGQICTHRTRAFVPRMMLDEFVERYLAEMGKLQVGDPQLETTQVGPLVSVAQRERVMRFVDSARAEGYAPITGGGIIELEAFPKGCFYQPTLYVDIPDSIEIAREEVFGPVGCIFAYDDLDEAISRANDTRYGLAASIWSRDVANAIRTAKRLEVGNVSINQAPVIYPWAPFTGHKRSGLGSEMGIDALREFVKTKNVMLKI